MATTYSIRSGRRGMLLLIVLAVVAGLLFAGAPAEAVHRGCDAIAPGFPDDCSFISPGGRVLAVGAGTSYVVEIMTPNNLAFITCLSGGPEPGVNICSAPAGYRVYVFARVGVVSARLLDA